MDLNSAELVDHGVDWYTATCNDEKRVTILQDKSALLLMREHAMGNEKRVWSMYGYEGFKCGGIQFGSRHDGTIVRLSGPTAHDNWQPFFKLATNSSRLDLQATFRLKEDTSHAIAKHFRAAMRLYRLGKVRQTVALYRSTDQSATIYLGKRESDRFGRIYQKDRESGLEHYRGCVRYELELKNELAHRTAGAVYSSSSPGQFIYATVRKYFGSAGIRLPSLHENRLALISAYRSRSDRDTRLKWFRESVAPAVRELLDQGCLALIIEALNLSEHVQPVGDVLQAARLPLQAEVVQ